MIIMYIKSITAKKKAKHLKLEKGRAQYGHIMKQYFRLYYHSRWSHVIMFIMSQIVRVKAQAMRQNLRLFFGGGGILAVKKIDQLVLLEDVYLRIHKNKIHISFPVASEAI